MYINNDDPVFVNIWINHETNEITHALIQGENSQVSCWTARPDSEQNTLFVDSFGHLTALGKKENSGEIYSDSIAHYNESDFLKHYNRDCIIEGAAQNGRVIQDLSELLLGEYPFIYNEDDECFERIDEKTNTFDQIIYGIKPINATHRVILFSLGETITAESFFEAKTLGKFGESRRENDWIKNKNNFFCQTSESSKSFTSVLINCLQDYGVSTDYIDGYVMSGYEPPDTTDSFIKCLYSIKADELKEEPDSKNWRIDGIEDTSMTDKFYSARMMLRSTCEQYLAHNSNQLKKKRINSVDDSGHKRESNSQSWIDFFNESISQYEEGIDSVNALEKEPEKLLGRLRCITMSTEEILSENCPKGAFTPKSDIRGLPVSVQLYLTLKDLRQQKREMQHLSHKFVPREQDISKMHNTIERNAATLEAYIKGVAVQELLDKLNDKHLTDIQAIRDVEDLLKNGPLIELMHKNRHKFYERDLKILSVLSICVGIGVFTTIALMLKRLYDTGGKSANFFKPLSQNYLEHINHITNKIEREEQQKGYFGSKQSIFH